MPFKHTFLFQEGSWTAEGFFFDENGNKIPLEGKSIITHTEKFWFYDSQMRLLEGNRTEFHNSYEILPFEKYGELTTWKSNNPAIGTFNGTFVIVEDSMLSFFSSEKDNYTGYEYLLRLSSVVYKNRGCLFKGTRKISSWSTTLYKFE
ncbi:MAG: hypothetical protein JW928_05370 [Candidatus Aureabacteria bacterium]|nr:hypothetical protein [Candidatus Auribacterota bacterium]